MASRKALVVGINDYGDIRNDLNSCIADAHMVAEILQERYGFTVSMLLDGQATVEAVDAGLDELFRGATPEDRFVFYYSGHGYRYQLGERRIEVLVLTGNRFFEDFRLTERTQGLPDGTLTVILDSCFAGGMEKHLVLSPSGFQLARPKVWKPTEAEIRRENRELSRVDRIVYKGFGLAPAALPIAVAKEFGFPEPPAELKSLVLQASGTSAAGQPRMRPAAIQPDVGAAVTRPTPRSPELVSRGAALAARLDRGAAPEMRVTALDTIAVAAAGGGAAPAIDKVTALDTIAVRETKDIEGPQFDVVPGAPTMAGELQLKGILLAASQANETASAKTNETEDLSAFTFGIVKVLAELGFDAPPRRIIPEVTARLHAMGFRQTPTLHEPATLAVSLAELPVIVMARRSAGVAAPRPGGATTAVAAPADIRTEDRGKEGTTMEKPYEVVESGAGGGIVMSDEQVKRLLDDILRVAPQALGAVVEALSKGAAAGPGAPPGRGVWTPPLEQGEVTMTETELKGFLSFVRRAARRVAPALGRIAAGIVGALSKELPGGMPSEKGEATIPLTSNQAKGLIDLTRTLLSELPRGKGLEAPAGEPGLVGVEMSAEQAKGWLQLLSIVPDLALRAAEALSKSTEVGAPAPAAPMPEVQMAAAPAPAAPGKELVLTAAAEAEPEPTADAAWLAKALEAAGVRR